jgi:hypothetical protein
MNDKIEYLHRSKVGKVSDKWSSYLTDYDALFQKFQYDPLLLLEIGVQNCGSLETWAKYFVNGQKFIGCDIVPNCGLHIYEDTKFHS